MTRTVAAILVLAAVISSAPRSGAGEATNEGKPRPLEQIFAEWNSKTAHVDYAPEKPIERAYFDLITAVGSSAGKFAAAGIEDPKSIMTLVRPAVSEQIAVLRRLLITAGYPEREIDLTLIALFQAIETRDLPILLDAKSSG